MWKMGKRVRVRLVGAWDERLALALGYKSHIDGQSRPLPYHHPTLALKFSTMKSTLLAIGAAIYASGTYLSTNGKRNKSLTLPTLPASAQATKYYDETSGIT